MRIISGKHKGRRITAPKALPVRPTKDMAKEGLFNILLNRYYFPDLKVLDLFAGTGNISFEFASRGVDDIVAVDVHPGCIDFIAKTSNALNMNISTVHSDVFTYLEKTDNTFDIIFADPFYSMELCYFEELIDVVFEKEMLLEEGLLIIEHSKQTSLEHLSAFDSFRKYGSSVFSFFRSK